jgi:hypothetical protein
MTDRFSDLIDRLKDCMDDEPDAEFVNLTDLSAILVKRLEQLDTEARDYTGEVSQEYLDLLMRAIAHAIQLLERLKALEAQK